MAYLKHLKLVEDNEVIDLGTMVLPDWRNNDNHRENFRNFIASFNQVINTCLHNSLPTPYQDNAIQLGPTMPGLDPDVSWKGLDMGVSKIRKSTGLNATQIKSYPKPIKNEKKILGAIKSLVDEYGKFLDHYCKNVEPNLSMIDKFNNEIEDSRTQILYTQAWLKTWIHRLKISTHKLTLESNFETAYKSLKKKMKYIEEKIGHLTEGEEENNNTEQYVKECMEKVFVAIEQLTIEWGSYYNFLRGQQPLKQQKHDHEVYTLGFKYSTANVAEIIEKLFKEELKSNVEQICNFSWKNGDAAKENILNEDALNKIKKIKNSFNGEYFETATTSCKQHFLDFFKMDLEEMGNPPDIGNLDIVNNNILLMPRATPELHDGVKGGDPPKDNTAKSNLGKQNQSTPKHNHDPAKHQGRWTDSHGNVFQLMTDPNGKQFYVPLTQSVFEASAQTEQQLSASHYTTLDNWEYSDDGSSIGILDEIPQRPRKGHSGGPPGDGGDDNDGGKGNGNPNNDKKEKVKSEKPDKDQKATKPAPSSVASSIFDTDPLNQMKRRLQDSIKIAKTTLEQSPERKLLLQRATNKCENAIKYVEDYDTKAMAAISVVDKELIEDFFKEVLDLQGKLDTSMSILEERDNYRRVQPRSSLPEWNGQITKYKQWSTDIDRATRYKEESEKMTDLKKAITGPHARGIKRLFEYAPTYKKMKDKLDQHFNNFEVCLPTQLKILEKLKVYPRYQSQEETNNIQAITEFYRFLEMHQATSKFTLQTYWLVSDKVSSDNKKILDRAVRKDYKGDWSHYIEDLEEMIEDNVQENGRLGKDFFMEEQGKKKKTPPSSFTHHIGTKTPAKEKPTPKCAFCDEDSHYSNKCAKLKLLSKEELLKILQKKSICKTCLYPLGPNHNKAFCEKSYNKKLKRYFWNACICKSGLHRLLCCKKPKPDSDGTLPPATSTGRIQAEILEVNSCPIGQSLSQSEILTIVGPKNDKISCVVLYDNQANSTIFSSSLRGYLRKEKKSIYLSKTIEGTTLEKGGKGTLTFQKNDGSLFECEGLIKQLKSNYVTSHQVRIPERWKTQYNTQEIESTLKGHYQVILGNDVRKFFPQLIDEEEGLILTKSRLTDKLILDGWNPKYCIPNSQKVYTTSTNTSRIESINIPDLSLHKIDQTLFNILSPEALIVDKKLCDTCHQNQIKQNKCENCSLEIETFSVEQKNELEVLNSCLTLDEKKNKWHFEGKYRENLSNLPTYEHQVKKGMEGFKNRLMKNSRGKEIAESLDKTVKENLEAGNYQWEKDAIAEHEGFDTYQKSWATSNFAESQEKNTKIRFVNNMSFNIGAAPSYNDVQYTAHSLNYKIAYILLRMRLFKLIALGDISKFYNCVQQSFKDSSLSRFYWKRGGILSDDEWETLVARVMLFGARHSQAVCNSAKRQTSTKYIEPEHPEVDEDVQKSYTDDIGCTTMGTMTDLESKTGIIDEGMKKGGFTVKKWLYSGEEGEHSMGPSSSPSSMLGIKWEAQKDIWKPSFKVNLLKKVRGRRPDHGNISTVEELKKFVTENGLSKRQALAAAHIVFDPNGLYLGVKNNLSILYRELLLKCPKLQWTEKIPESLHSIWIRGIEMVLEIGDMEVPRCALPEQMFNGGGIELVVVCDGGGQMSVARAFIRSTKEDEDGKFTTNYLQGVSKIGPNSGPNNSVKTEMNALVLGARLISLILTFDHLKFENIYLLSDSRIMAALIGSKPDNLKLYYIERVRQVQEIIMKHKVQCLWTPGKFSDGDFGSKLNLTQNVCLLPQYWHGHFLENPKEDWPTKQFNHDEDEISDVMNPKMKLPENTTLKTEIEISFLDNLLERKSWESVITILSYVLIFGKLKASGFSTARTKAKTILYKLAQPSNDQVKSVSASFQVRQNEDGTFLLTRPFDVGKKITNFEYLVLDGTSKVGQSILKSHHIHVSSVEREVSRLLDSGVYIIGARNYLKKLQLSCHTCKRIRSEVSKAKMGPSPILVAERHGPMSHVVIDLWGPFTCKVSRNVTMKGYFLTTSCLYTRYTVFQLMLSATADALLMALKQTIFQMNAKMPQKIYSDSGRQILPIKGLETTEDSENGLEIANVATMMKSNGIELITSTSAPWRQTGAESLHRILRLNLKRSGLTKGSKYSIPQWNYIASTMTHQINQRTLSLKYMNENLLSLTPAKMIFGMSQGSLEKMNLDLANRKLFQNLRRLEAELDEWKTLWHHTYLQEVKKFSKWCSEKNPLDVGSVVLITDHLNLETGQPALGVVKAKATDRTFTVSYCKKPAELNKAMEVAKPALMDTLERPAQKLVKITYWNMEQIKELEEKGMEIDVDPFSTKRTPSNHVTDTMDNQLENIQITDVHTCPEELCTLPGATCTNMPTPNQDAEDASKQKELPKKKTLIVKSYFDDEAQEITDLKGKKKTTKNSKKK